MRDELSAEEMRAWAPRPDPSAPATDLRLPGYSGFQLVAQGGEGAVYRARQDGLGRDVAIKALQAVDPATQARFRRELEITVRLGRQHPHIVTVLDTGTLPDGRPCIVMEFYDLGSLHDRLRAHGPLPVAEVVAAGVAVADALAFAHDQGILHRDVKPQNVLVLPTSYVLADFGIARGADAGHSASLQMVSYRHAAPQMIDGAAPAAADDLWSLGSTLFTLLAGVPPFAGDNPDEDTVLPYLDRVRSTEPRPLTRQDVPSALVDVISRCLGKRREDRFPDAAALRDALASVSADLRRWQPAAPLATSIAPVDPDATSLTPASPSSTSLTPVTPDSTSLTPPNTNSTSLTPVDPDSTSIAPGTALPPSLAPGSTPVADFGPPPTPPAEPETPAEPPAPAVEPRGTMTGRLADLTERRSAPEPPDFGPGAPAWPPASGPPAPATPHHPGVAEPTEVRSTPATGPGSAEESTGVRGRGSAHDGQAAPPVARLEAVGRAGQDHGRDLPTVPKLTPTRFDGFPAMPDAHEWEYDTAPGAVAPPERKRWRGFAVAGIVAAVVGVGIGVLASRDVVNTPATDTVAPSTTVAIPPGGDPAVAPVLTKVDDRGESAELTWTDPTDGRAQYVLYDVTIPGGTPQPITAIAAGLTSFVVTGLDPSASQYCFQLVAIGLDDPSTQRGASDKLCVSR